MYYLYYDGHGDLAATADSSGNVVSSYTYDPFGAPSSAPSNTTSHLFVGAYGKQYDSTTGLILMGARPYGPTIGRFLSVDPVDGGSLNNYDYAGQDPINGYDLNGLFLIKIGKLGGGKGVRATGALIRTVLGLAGHPVRVPPPPSGKPVVDQGPVATGQPNPGQTNTGQSSSGQGTSNTANYTLTPPTPFNEGLHDHFTDTLERGVYD